MAPRSEAGSGFDDRTRFQASDRCASFALAWAIVCDFPHFESRDLTILALWFIPFSTKDPLVLKGLSYFVCLEFDFVIFKWVF